jgi:hypothetical protein
VAAAAVAGLGLRMAALPADLVPAAPALCGTGRVRLAFSEVNLEGDAFVREAGRIKEALA